MISQPSGRPHSVPVQRRQRHGSTCHIASMVCAPAALFFTIVLMLLPPMMPPAGAESRPPDAVSILERVDANLSSQNRVLTSEMVIHGRRGSRSVTAKSWIQGDTRSFTEYLAPARERGTKMLKLGDKLWMYSPDTDRTIQISGHMLRQSVMGSDLSYEDMMEDSKLADAYDAAISGQAEVDGRPCWVLDLKAKTTGAAYDRRRLWVDRERMIPLKEELYAKSGKLLKRIELKNVENDGRRWFPRLMIFKDMLKSGDGTEFIIKEITFDTAIPPDLFSRSALRR